MAEIGFGVIGMGRMGRLHAGHLQGAVRDARLIGVTAGPDDVSALRAEGLPFRIFDSVEELLADPEIEAVVIASPSSLHGLHIAAAAAAGRAIFCEKPLADSVAGAEQAVEAVEQAS